MWEKKDNLSENQPGYFPEKSGESFWRAKRVGLIPGFFLIFSVASLVAFLVIRSSSEVEDGGSGVVFPQRAVREIIEEKVEEEDKEKPKFKFMYNPVPIDMEDIKKRGCVADGILSEYGKDTK